MIQKWRGILVQILAYTLYGIVIFTFLVYLKFPYDLVRTRLLSVLQNQSNVQIGIGKITPALPLDIALQNLQLETTVDTQPIKFLEIQELRTRPQVFSLLHGAIGLRFHGNLYGGELTGQATVERNGVPAKKVAVYAHVQGLELQRYTPLVTLYEARCQGEVEAEVRLDSPINRWIEGKGEASFTVKNGEVAELKILNFFLPAIQYEELKGEVVLDERKLTIRLLELLGREVNADIKGAILLADPLPQSTLNLTVRVRTSGTLGQQFGPVLALLKVPRDRQGFLLFRVGGSLAEPRLSL